uniref:Inositol polyphosphate-related phosphatase domain-containing protein n=1 Tax=Leersia perrieri TaxID=77586 RepID=A0A0D9X9Y8_9ORYZ
MDPDDEAAPMARPPAARIAVPSYSLPTPRHADDVARHRHSQSELGCFHSGGGCGGAGALPEFVGEGGGEGIYRVPLRAAAHPARPPAVEVRPHPLRETQVGSFLRTLACAGRGRRRGQQLWVFRESVVPVEPVLCVEADGANGVVWTGHRDGRIRAWSMDLAAGGGGEDEAALTWQAYSRTPVLSMVITSYGEIWAGSEGGIIKAWPWEVIANALSLTPEEKLVAELRIEKFYIDLRNNGNISSFPAADVKHLLADHSRAKVWSLSSMAFAIWDARTRELLKVESARVEAPVMPEQFIEEEIKVKPVKKDKPQSPFAFFQKSRNALMGAAGAVRRAATKGTFVEDNRRIETVVQAMNGTVWSGCTDGSIILWDGNGNRLQEFQQHCSSVQCMKALGERVWVGYASGIIQVMDVEGDLLAEWTAHSCPVIQMAIGGSYIFSLAHHGGIRGWPLASPGPLDDILRTELSNRELSYRRIENIKMLVGTWNVGQEKASYDSLYSWLGGAFSDVELVVVGLQEVEMGAGVLAMAAAKESVGLEGSANGQWWIDNIGRSLDEGISFHRVGSRQLAGLLIAAWARKDLKPHVGDVDAAAVPCGFGRAIGNKGGVGLRIRVYDRRICFVNNHFAAHLENANGNQVDEDIPEMAEADMVVFLGDFNYRLNGITYDEARDMVSQRSFDWLRERDQLQAEMRAGRVFQGMREGVIRFPPTYKFQRHLAGLAGYDSGEKKRIPAWCDRILYRDSRAVLTAECSLECPVVAKITSYEACMNVTDSDHKPVRCAFSVDIARVDEFIRRQEYGKILESDKRIRSLLRESHFVPETIISTNNIILENQDHVVLRITNDSQREMAAFEILCESQSITKQDGTKSEFPPRASFGLPLWLEIEPSVGLIEPGETMEVTVHHEDYYTQEVFVNGVLENCWCEVTRDKEAILLVNVTGSTSTETITHRINVRHCCSTISAHSPINPLSIATPSTDALLGEASTRSSKKNPSNYLQRSDFKPFGSSEVHDLCPM